LKITDIKVHLIDTKREFSHVVPYGKLKIDGGLLRVFTDSGIEGNIDYDSHAQPSKVLAESILSMKPLIIGEDPFNIERIWKRTFKATRHFVSIQAAGCIDAALWDIFGKALKLPVYKLLGGFKDRVRAYACTMTPKDLNSYLEQVKSLKQRGFTAIKLHPWADIDRDIELCRLVRETVGKEVDLMFDAICQYDRHSALRVGRVLDELSFYFYEDPIPDDDVEGYIKLSNKLNVAIAGFDSLRLNFGNYADYMSRGAVEILRADAARQGVTWTRKLAAVAEGFGRTIDGHAFGLPLAQAANLHLMAGISNGEFFEMPVPEGFMDTAMQETITPDADGYVSLPQKPGLGLSINWDKMNEITTAILE
jgi:L-alanine-DL-glutamate epimerase-like enolase superfamily enzyme